MFHSCMYCCSHTIKLGSDEWYLKIRFSPQEWNECCDLAIGVQTQQWIPPWLILEGPPLESLWELLFSLFLFVRFSLEGRNVLVPQTDAGAIRSFDTFCRKTYHFNAELQTNASNAGGDDSATFNQDWATYNAGHGSLICQDNLEQAYCLHVWLPSKFIFRIQNFQWNYWTDCKGAELTYTSNFLQRKCSTFRGKWRD